LNILCLAVAKPSPNDLQVLRLLKLLNTKLALDNQKASEFDWNPIISGLPICY